MRNWSSRRWLAEALGRSFGLLVLVVIVSALRSVDRNRGVIAALDRPASLGAGAYIALVIAAALLPAVFVILLRPAAVTAGSGDRYAALWRLTCLAGALAAAVRAAYRLGEWTLGWPRTSGIVGLSNVVILGATVILLLAWCIEGLQRGPGVRMEGGRSKEMLRAARLVRVGFAISLAFAAIAFATPYASAQIGDLLLAWTDVLLPAPATFGVAAILLLGLVLQEGGVSLVGRDGTQAVRRRGPTSPFVRLTSAVVLIGAVVLFIGPGTFEPGSLILAIPLGLLVLAEWAERQLVPVPRPDPTSGATYLGIAALPLMALAGGLANATVDALFLYGPDAPTLLRALPVAVIFLVALGALVVSTGSVRRARPDESERRSWVWSLTATAVVGLVWWIGLPGLAGLLALIAIVVYAGVIRGEKRLWALVIARAASVAFVAGTLAWPIAVGSDLGLIGAVGFAVAGLVSVTHYLIRLFALVGVPQRARVVLPFHHVPVVTLLLVWVVGAVIVASPSRHDVRMNAASTIVSPRGVEVGQAVETWWDAQPESASSTGSETTVPLVIAAAEGGGIRASYWTSGVLDVIAAGRGEDRRLGSVPLSDATCDAAPAAAKQELQAGRLFLLSGASGGSVGGYAYAREMIERGCLAPGWYVRWFARDLLGPTSSWALAHDLLATLFHQAPEEGGECARGPAWLCGLLRDRARILEEALDEDGVQRQIGIRDVRFAAPSPAPHLIFNTASDRLRTRVPISTLHLPEREDVVENALDENCAGDLPWVSAAVFSARFPFATPTGRIFCAKRALVDGGYLENTGLGAIAEVLPEIGTAVARLNATNASAGRPSIRIVVLEIANGPGRSTDPITPERVAVVAPTESPSPRFGILGLAALPTYPTSLARVELGTSVAGLRAKGIHVDTVTIRPDVKPGWKASVGWRMSRASRTELESALTTSPCLTAASEIVAGTRDAIGTCR